MTAQTTDTQTPPKRLTPAAIAVGIVLIVVLIIGGFFAVKILTRPNAAQAYVNCLNHAIATGTPDSACTAP